MHILIIIFFFFLWTIFKSPSNDSIRGARKVFFPYISSLIFAILRSPVTDRAGASLPALRCLPRAARPGWPPRLPFRSPNPDWSQVKGAAMGPHGACPPCPSLSCFPTGKHSVLCRDWM